MHHTLYVLFGAAFSVAVILAAGRLILRPVRRALLPGEGDLLGFPTGSAAVSLAVFLLASAHLIHKGVLLAGGLAVIAAAWRFRACPPVSRPPVSPLPRPWPILFGLIFGAFLVVYLVNAMAPEMSPDGATYHLGLVSRYYRERGFPRITTNVYANLSQGIEMLFLLAWPFGKNSAAALVHLAFLVVLSLSMAAWGRRAGHPLAGAAGALFLFAAPVAGIDGTSAYNDVGLACVLFTVFYLLQIWTAEGHPGLLLPVGLCAGFAFAVKYTGFLAVPYALAVAGWRLYRGRKPLARPLAVIAAASLLLVVPWLVKNWIVVHNPVSPFLPSIFPNPYIHPAFLDEWTAFLGRYRLPDRWQIPLEVTVRGHMLGGLLGPLFLLSPLALLSLRHRPGRALLLPGVLFLLPYPANIGTRFLLPALPFWSLAMALAVQAWRPLLAVLVLAHALLSWPSILRKYCAPYAWRVRNIPWKAGLGITPPEDWLLEHYRDYPVARLVEARVPPGARVFSFQPVAEAYTSREILVGFQAAENQVLRDILLTPLVREAAPVRRVVFQFPPRPLRFLRVVQDAASPSNSWSVTELRVYSAGRELERASRWRLRAAPNPWDVQMAFDNSPVTRWKSWEPARPGMFLEIDFGGQETAGTVAVEMPDDQGEMRLHLEADGSRMAARPVETRVPVPERLRRSAILELKEHRIGYLLVSSEDYGWLDFASRPAAWGITQVGESFRHSLFRLD